ncbi:MAG: CoA transferase, partial [Alphaproteobacteria bacterium]
MGPLQGLKVVELAGIGPGPFAAMLLSDMGAEVLRVDRTQPSGLGVERPARFDLLNRGRRSVAVDMKDRRGVEVVLRLIERAHALIEPFRPGVAERLGIGPDVCLGRNPRLVYGRMTGWGQDGPLAPAAGHDINYIALSGALAAIGPEGGAPVQPLNLVGEFGGGALYLAYGIMCSVWEAARSCKGQVV